MSAFQDTSTVHALSVAPYSPFSSQQASNQLNTDYPVADPESGERGVPMYCRCA